MPPFYLATTLRGYPNFPDRACNWPHRHKVGKQERSGTAEHSLIASMRWHARRFGIQTRAQRAKGLDA